MIQAGIHYGTSATVVSVTFLMSRKREKDVYLLLGLIDDE